MKIDSIKLIITEDDWEKMEKAIIEDATEKTDCNGNTWFKNEDEFEDWAGDRFWEFLVVAFETLGIKVDY